MQTAAREIRERGPRRPTRAETDIKAQRVYDARRKMDWPVWEARIEAVRNAKAAVRAGEAGSRFALRQALVDLAACCEEMCVPMLAPNEKLMTVA